MLSEESKSVTTLVHPPAYVAIAPANAAPATAGDHSEVPLSKESAEELSAIDATDSSGAGESVFFDIRAEPDVYRRLEESIRNITSGNNNDNKYNN